MHIRTGPFGQPDPWWKDKKKAFAISGIKSTPGRRSTIKKLVLRQIKAADKANTPPTALIINLSVKLNSTVLHLQQNCDSLQVQITA